MGLPSSYPSKAKAGKMLRDNQAHGRPLTQAQKGLFGILRSGKKPAKVKKR